MTDPLLDKLILAAEASGGAPGDLAALSDYLANDAAPDARAEAISRWLHVVTTAQRALAQLEQTRQSLSGSLPHGEIRRASRVVPADQAEVLEFARRDLRRAAAVGVIEAIEPGRWYAVRLREQDFAGGSFYGRRDLRELTTLIDVRPLDGGAIGGD